MKVTHSHTKTAHEVNQAVVQAIATISIKYLKHVVETVSIPRHADAEAENNKQVAAWILSELESFGYRVELQGRYNNVVATPAINIDRPLILVGAHYDSVPKTPGADDNASAVAAMLGCARALAKTDDDVPVCFVAFNREEDGFLGSEDFVNEYVASGKIKLSHAHILEMVGYASDKKGSQQLPPMLPVKVPDTGNFLGILGNSNSNQIVDTILAAGKSYFPDFPVIGLKLYLEAERIIPNMTRSDHVSFWANGIPATMWTDTADFRNPHYHRRTDTPDTLNYDFLASVTKVLIASLVK